MIGKPAFRSDGRNRHAAISAQGMRNISTPDEAPMALALTATLAMPTSGSMARPASGWRRDTHGTAAKKGVDRKVSSAGARRSPTIG